MKKRKRMKSKIYLQHYMFQYYQNNRFDDKERKLQELQVSLLTFPFFFVFLILKHVFKTTQKRKLKLKIYENLFLDYWSIFFILC